MPEMLIFFIILIIGWQIILTKELVSLFCCIEKIKFDIGNIEENIKKLRKEDDNAKV